MEEICRLRRQDGLPALAIQWGLIGEVGAVATNADLAKNIKEQFESIPMVDALAFVNDLLVHEVNSHAVSYLAQRLRTHKTQSEKINPEQVIQQICHVVKMDLMKCNLNDTLEFLGADSLQVVEIQTILIKAFQEAFPLKKISAMKIGELKQLIEDKAGQQKQWGSSATVAEKTDMELIKKLNQAGNRSAIYLFLGYGIDGKTFKVPKTTRFDVNLVFWQNTKDIPSLIRTIEEDVKNNQYQEVKFLTHSSGYYVAREIMAANSIKVEKLASISLVSEELIANVVNVPNLEKIPDAECEKMYRDLWLFVQNHLPGNQLRQQAILLSKMIQRKQIPPHLVLIPREDTVCDRSKKGIEIQGNHQIESFDMNEVYALL
jgi:hypothetical protein